MSKPTPQYAVGQLWLFGRAHRRWLRLGCFAALWVVVLRVAIPWPLKVMLSPWMDEPRGDFVWMDAIVPIVLFGLLMVLLGLADLLSRLWFARYAIGTVRDVRDAAFASADRAGASPGDLISRLVGDTARIKAGMKGFLVHVATNGAMAIGVAGVMLWVYWPIGVVLFVGAIMLGLLTYAGARRIYDAASRYRAKEGKLADAMRRSYERRHDAKSFRRTNRKSGRHEARITRIQGMTTWGAHVVFAVMVVASLAFGGLAVSRGTLEPSSMALFVMYALMLRAPVVQLARQGSRTGKIAACARRVAELTSVESVGRDAVVTAPIASVMLSDVRVRARASEGKFRRLGPINLELGSGERVALVGPPASGKTTLLRVISGAQRVHRGALSFAMVDGGDDAGAGVVNSEDLMEWPARALGEVLGCDAGVRDRLMGASGIGKTGVRDWSDMSVVIGPRELSAIERRVVATIRAMGSSGSVVLLDDPALGLGPARTEAFIEAICSEQGDRLLVVSMRARVAPEAFGRVIKLQKGRVVKDTAPGLRENELRETA